MPSLTPFIGSKMQGVQIYSESGAVVIETVPQGRRLVVVSPKFIYIDHVFEGQVLRRKQNYSDWELISNARD